MWTQGSFSLSIHSAVCTPRKTFCQDRQARTDCDPVRLWSTSVGWCQAHWKNVPIHTIHCHFQLRRRRKKTAKRKKLPITLLAVKHETTFICLHTNSDYKGRWLINKDLFSCVLHNLLTNTFWSFASYNQLQMFGFSDVVKLLGSSGAQRSKKQCHGCFRKCIFI